MNLRQLEKVELHRHLEGSIRLSTLLELAPQVGVEVPKNIESQKSTFLVTTPMKDLATVLNKFWMTQAVLKSEEILSRITYEAIADAADEGIRILELRYAPTFIRKGHENLSYEQIHRAILKGLSRAAHFDIAVGLICIIQRTLPIETSIEVLNFAIEHKDTFIALDLADDEDLHDTKTFQDVFQTAKKNGLHITIHAGEVSKPIAPQNVIDAIEFLGAERIGHGVQIYQHSKAIEFVKSRKIPLELCVTSNWLTNAVSGIHAHPIKELMKKGVLCTINSDDPGIFGIDLTNEYEVLKKYYQFSKEDFDRCNDIAAQASFIPLIKKQKHWPRPIHKI